MRWLGERPFLGGRLILPAHAGKGRFCFSLLREPAGRSHAPGD